MTKIFTGFSSRDVFIVSWPATSTGCIVACGFPYFKIQGIPGAVGHPSPCGSICNIIARHKNPSFVCGNIPLRAPSRRDETFRNLFGRLYF